MDDSPISISQVPTVVDREVVKEALLEILRGIPSISSLLDSERSTTADHHDESTSGTTEPQSGRAGAEARSRTTEDINSIVDSEVLKNLQTIAGSKSSESPSTQFSLTTMLSALLPKQDSPSKSVTVGPTTPPVPTKLAQKIWDGQFVELDELLPARLGAAESTVLDALLRTEKVRQKKKIDSIEEWVICFNTFISVVAIKSPDRVRDLLAYCSTIVKASQDFRGLPWLDYDVNFRKAVATKPGTTQWQHIDTSLWTLAFLRAEPRKEMSTTNTATGKVTQRSQRFRGGPYSSNRTCFGWNSQMGCQRVQCPFSHTCLRCPNQPHSVMDCPSFSRHPIPPPPPPSGGANFRPPSWK